MSVNMPPAMGMEYSDHALLTGSAINSLSLVLAANAPNLAFTPLSACAVGRTNAPRHSASASTSASSFFTRFIGNPPILHNHRKRYTSLTLFYRKSCTPSRETAFGQYFLHPKSAFYAFYSTQWMNLSASIQSAAS